MRRLFMFILVSVAVTVNAQPGGRLPILIKSPEVALNGKVTYRFLAPNAKTVLLLRDGAMPQPMKKDSIGIWSFSETLAPDIYPYSFNADGNILPDPNNPALKPIYKMSIGQSLLHVPGAPSLVWDSRDVPHGTVHRHEYKSEVIGNQSELYVYTPPNYDPNRSEPYPVLYLFHGLTDEASAWISGGKANTILDNLIAAGEAEPMVIVNTLGYGVPDLLEKGFLGMSPERFKKNNQVFVSSLVKEVIPMVEKVYNTGRGQQRRAIAGLSMGGGQALLAGLNNPGLFNYLGAFSPAVLVGEDFKEAFPSLNNDTNKKIGLIWIRIGKNDFLLDQNTQFIKLMESRKIKVDYKVTDGAHTWMVWRRYLAEFVPLLFK